LIPATEAGRPAITRLITEGVNVNVTLLFSCDMYVKVAEAYLTGLEQLQEYRTSLHGVTSVASFFVSRIDSAVEKLGAPENVLGKVANADAVLRELASAGISLVDITGQLLDDGIRLFDEAYDALIETIDAKSAEYRQGQATQ